MKVRLRRRRYRCSPGGAILPGLHLYLLHIGAKPDLSMRSARTVNLEEDAAQACQMLEEASSAVFVATGHG